MPVRTLGILWSIISAGGVDRDQLCRSYAPIPDSRWGGFRDDRRGLARTADLKAGNHLTYSLQNESADAYAENITMQNGSYQFDVMIGDRKMEKLLLHMGGMHNVENAVAAITVASSLEIENEKIKAAMRG